MANLIELLTSISPGLRSGPSPGRRLLALALSVTLVLASTLPAVAVAGEADSEGIGTAPPVEVPGSADFDPGGEEAGLEDAPATGGAEEGAVEVEPEVDLEAPAPAEVTSAIDESGLEEPEPQPEEVPPAPAPVSDPEPVQQAATEPAPSEPVANSSLAAPKQKARGKDTSHQQGSPAAMTSTEPIEEAPSSPAPQPQAATPIDSGRNLAGKRFYTVQPGDCLWHIAASLLPGADDGEVASEVARLWQLNEDRIGTGNPSLLYVGTELRLR
jgi:LysM domain